MFKTLLCSLFIFTTFSSFAKGWKHEKSKHGIDVYTKSISNSSIKAIKGVGIVNSNIAKLCAILRNVETATKWIPDLIARNYVKNISDTEAILQDVTDMPWPVTDRDYVAHYKLSISENKEKMILNFKSVYSPETLTPKYERAEVKMGSVTFTPISKNKTKVELDVLVDPRGGIPAWVVNIVQVSVPFNFIRSLDKFAKDTELKPLPGIQKLLDELKPPK